MKVLFCRVMPFPTMLNRARMFKKMGWDCYLLHDQPFANSKLLMASAKVFTDVWSQHFLIEDSDELHNFMKDKGFDLLYTIGPPDKFNVNFSNAPCPWIQDNRDLVGLCTPKAKDPEVLAKAWKEFNSMSDQTAMCINSSDLTVYVTPWQRDKGVKLYYPEGGEPPSVWLPNIPFRIPEFTKDPDREDDVVYWGYTGNMKAAWQNAPDWAGNVASELEKLGMRHEFHFWNMMEMHKQQSSPWFYGHATGEQHDVIAEMGTLLDYGVLAPPTLSDGTNGLTGWPGKIGDYIAAGLDVFIPSKFRLSNVIRKNGWGFAYDSPKDVARIMAGKRRSPRKRAPAPCLQDEPYMKTLQMAVDLATQRFKSRYVEPVYVPSAPLKKTLVASDGNRFHAKHHIAPILGAPYTAIMDSEKKVEDVDIDHRHYKDLYLLGMWAFDEERISKYEEYLPQFERVVVQWAGSDVSRILEHDERERLWKLVNLPHIRHFVPRKGMADELSEIIDTPIKILNTPTKYIYPEAFRLPKQFAVSVYYALHTKGTRNLYGLDYVDEVIKRMPNTLFYLHCGSVEGSQKEKLRPKHLPPNAQWLGSIGESQYPEYLKNVSVLLRMTRRDGLPMSMVEHFAAGRNVIMGLDYPFVTKVDYDPVEIVKALNKLAVSREVNRAASEYWRAWNDHDRFRDSIRSLYEDCNHAVETGTQVKATGT